MLKCTDERSIDRKYSSSNYVDPSDGVRHVSLWYGTLDSSLDSFFMLLFSSLPRNSSSFFDVGSTASPGLCWSCLLSLTGLFFATQHTKNFVFFSHTSTCNTKRLNSNWKFDEDTPNIHQHQLPPSLTWTSSSNVGVVLMELIKQ